MIEPQNKNSHMLNKNCILNLIVTFSQFSAYWLQGWGLLFDLLEYKYSVNIFTSFLSRGNGIRKGGKKFANFSGIH